MTASNHVASVPATQVPAYCHPGILPGATGPALIPGSPRWVTCVKAGWDEPTTGAAHLGHLVTGTTTSAVGMMLALALLAGFILWVISGRRTAPEAD